MKVVNLPVIADVPTRAEPKKDDTASADFSSELDNKMASAQRKSDTTDSKRDKPDDSDVKIKTDRLDIASQLPSVSHDGRDKTDKSSDDPTLAVIDPRMEQLQLLLVQAMQQQQQTDPLMANALPANLDSAGMPGVVQANLDSAGALAALPGDIDSFASLGEGASPEKLATLMALAEKGATDSKTAAELTTTSANKALFTLAAGQQKTVSDDPVKQPDLLPIAGNTGDSKTSENLLTTALAATPVTSQVKVSAEGAHQEVLPLAEHAPLAHFRTASVDTVVKSTAVLNQELGTPAWQNSLGQNISLFTRNGIQNAELRLHPQELGAIQINLRLNHDQVQLHFVTDNHQVRAAIEAAMPHLRTTLADSGLNLEQSSVGADASSSGGFFSQPGHEGGKAAYDGEISDAALLPEEEAEIPVRIVRYASGINTFA